MKKVFIWSQTINSPLFFRKIEGIERYLTGTDGYLGFTWNEGASVGLYLSKMAARNAESSIPTILPGKIGDCESNDERDIWWIWWYSI